MAPIKGWLRVKSVESKNYPLVWKLKEDRAYVLAIKYYSVFKEYEVVRDGYRIFGSKNKSEAKDYAIRYMRSHPRG